MTGPVDVLVGVRVHGDGTHEVAVQTAGGTTVIGDVGRIPELDAASAETLTVQIVRHLDRTWELIVLAYQGRAWKALGYQDWTAYVQDRFKGQLIVPRSEQPEAINALTRHRLSQRAIAGILGIDHTTVGRHLATGANAPVDDEDDGTIIGLDGKRRQRFTSGPASVDAAEQAEVDDVAGDALADWECDYCEGQHPIEDSVCPWELYESGAGPMPPLPQFSDTPAIPGAKANAKPPKQRARRTTDELDDELDEDQLEAEVLTGPLGEDVRAADREIRSAVARLEVIANQGFSTLPVVVRQLKDAIESWPVEAPMRPDGALAGDLRQVARNVQGSLDELPLLASRLDDLADAIEDGQ